jgi:hypothetical protein
LIEQTDGLGLLGFEHAVREISGGHTHILRSHKRRGYQQYRA